MATRCVGRCAADPRFEHATIIAQTGWGQESDREKTKAAGFDVHLVKPVGLKLLEEALGKVAAQPRA